MLRCTYIACLVIFLHDANVRFTLPCVNKAAAGVILHNLVIWQNKYVMIASLKPTLARARLRHIHARTYVHTRTQKATGVNIRRSIISAHRQLEDQRKGDGKIGLCVFVV
jgi:hypothetical protein